MIRLNNLSVRYRHRTALQNVSGRFSVGSLTAVMGPNGAGKSSLLKALVGALPTPAGCVELGISAKHMAYLPQLAEIDRSFPIQVRDCVLLGAWSRAGALRRIDAEAQDRVDQALHTAGLQGLERRAIGSLSSGQLQRVLFARVLAQDAPLILLDEPFNAVDSRTTGALLDIVARWHAEHRTVIAVIHDPVQARAHFAETLLLAREVIAWGRTEDVLQPAHLQRAQCAAEAWELDSEAPASRHVRPLPKAVRA
jgi:zinc/manganese transport system ATP-binding protein